MIKRLTVTVLSACLLGMGMPRVYAQADRETGALQHEVKSLLSQQKKLFDENTVLQKQVSDDVMKLRETSADMKAARAKMQHNYELLRFIGTKLNGASGRLNQISAAQRAASQQSQY